MRRSLVVEIVGPAGAGKSSLAQSFLEHGRGALLARPPQARDWRNAPFYARNLIASLPLLARVGMRGSPRRPLSGEMISCIAVLNGWHAILASLREGTDDLILLDQGPLFFLAKLLAISPYDAANDSKLVSWYSHYSSVYSCVVYLDADDSVLIPRIRDRQKDHRIKRMDDLSGVNYLTELRLSLNYVLEKLLEASPDMRLLRYDSSLHTSEELAQRLLKDLYKW